jgi:hypothetical protein
LLRRNRWFAASSWRLRSRASAVRASSALFQVPAEFMVAFQGKSHPGRDDQFRNHNHSEQRQRGKFGRVFDVISRFSFLTLRRDVC